jgi:hypothetical protein
MLLLQHGTIIARNWSGRKRHLTALIVRHLLSDLLLVMCDEDTNTTLKVNALA